MANKRVGCNKDQQLGSIDFFGNSRGPRMTSFPRPHTRRLFLFLLIFSVSFCLIEVNTQGHFLANQATIGTSPQVPDHHPSCLEPSMAPSTDTWVPCSARDRPEASGLPLWCPILLILEQNGATRTVCPTAAILWQRWKRPEMTSKGQHLLSTV